MTRFVSSTNATEAAQPSIVMTVLVDLDFSSGNLRVHDGVGTLVMDTSPQQTFLGVGQFGGIEGAVQDSLEVIARPVKLSLTGVDSSLITSAMTEDYQGRQAIIYLGFLDTTTRTFIDTPETIWEGRMDYMEVEMGRESGTIRVNCEHRLRKEPRISRYTNEDQQIAYPGDTFFKYLPNIQGFKSQWGDKATAFITTPNLTRGGRGPGKFEDFNPLD